MGGCWNHLDGGDSGLREFVVRSSSQYVRVLWDVSVSFALAQFTFSDVWWSALFFTTVGLVAAMLTPGASANQASICTFQPSSALLDHGLVNGGILHMQHVCD